jgi:hypothetical protein
MGCKGGIERDCEAALDKVRGLDPPVCGYRCRERKYTRKFKERGKQMLTSAQEVDNHMRELRGAT